MPRRYTATTRRVRRYARPAATRAKYSIETATSNTALIAMTDSGTTKYGQTVVVPATTIQGMRKVKHMQITVVMQHNDDVNAWAGGAPILWALVYAPQGSPENLEAPKVDGSVYEPNQFVIASGIADSNAGPVRINTPLARNLNSGDRIVLVYRLLNGTSIAALDASASILTMCRYAITLN